MWKWRKGWWRLPTCLAEGRLTPLALSVKTPLARPVRQQLIVGVTCPLMSFDRAQDERENKPCSPYQCDSILLWVQGRALLPYRSIQN